MKKILSSSLIAFIIIANLFAPISVVFNKKNSNFNVEKNIVSAADGGMQLTITPIRSDNYINLKISVNYVLFKNTSEGVRVVLKNLSTGTLSDPKYPDIASDSPPILNGKNINNPDGFYTTVKYNNVKFENLSPETEYRAIVTGRQINRLSFNWFSTNWNISDLWNNGKYYKQGLKNHTLWEISKTIQIKTLKTGGTENIGNSIETKNNNYAPDIMPSCTIGNWSVGGCFAQFIYAAVFVPSSYLFALAGTFFDNTFNYSVQSSSYKSQFVVQGWNIVRDFVNMFFIFVLLYIAFSTILNINGAKTKEMVVNVIIIGLLINFSLFATRVIIDTSNILARVFYNTNTIKITQVDGPDASGVVTALNPNGVIPLSAALVNKVNPQAIIINAGKVGNIVDKGGQTNNSKNKGGVSTGTFILITLLSSGINIIGFVVFLTVGLLFIIRVVGLWLAMILAPFAFFSYTIPAMQSIDMVGWKKWWPETIKLAFMAPIFIFFIYLILQFLNTGMGTIDNATGGLSFVLRTIIPFAFIMVLLIKAKDIAVKMSGEMGAAVSKAGSAIGGMALGAATGGASMAMRGTIGAHANKIANDEQLQKDSLKGGIKGFKARMKLRTASNLSKNSFDFRNTKLGAKAGKSLGVDLGKGKKGGFDKYKKNKDKERKEKLENIKKIATPKEKGELDKAQIDLKETMLVMKPELDKIDKEITKTRQGMRDAKDGMNSVLAEKKLAELKILQSQRDATRESTAKILSWKDKTDSSGNVVTDSDGYTIQVANTYGSDFKDSNGNIIKTIKNAESTEEKAIHNLEKAKNKIINKYADHITSKSNKILNTIASLGQDRGSSVEETAQDVRVGGKVEKDKGDTGK